jgi:hypothetical protein
VRVAREIVRIESSSAWTAWQAGERITPEASRALFRIDSYTSAELLDIKVTRLLSVFEPGSAHRRFLEEASNAMRNGEEGSDA